MQTDEGHFTASLKASPRAMLYWALQYNDKAEIISPKSLRDEVVAALKSALKMYGED